MSGGIPVAVLGKHHVGQLRGPGTRLPPNSSRALSERVFVQKLKRVGFEEVEVLERNPFALDQAAQYPLFDAEVIQLMRDLIPEERHDKIAVSAIVAAISP